MRSDLHLFHGDCWQVMDELIAQGVQFDSVVTDPPYHLASIVKRFGKPGSAPAQYGTDGAFSRSSKGFMGKIWDGGDIAFNPETWARCLQLLKPGGHLLAFAASKNYHRLACAVEDAGFEIRDQIMWLYGSGMPKSHDVSKAIDKAAGAKREVVGTVRAGIARRTRNGGEIVGSDCNEEEKQSPITIPSTEAAKQWEGWGTALKPAHEPIVLARKPFEGTVAQNVLEYGTGGINIDDCRVEAHGRPLREKLADLPSNGIYGEGLNSSRAVGETDVGRWPANVIHDGSEEVLATFPDAKGQQGDLKGHNKTRQSPNGIFGEMAPAKDHLKRGDSGTAARFFYSAKASKKERAESKHPTVKPISLMEYLCRLITPPGGHILDPFAGTGSTGVAALNEGFEITLIEKEKEYFDDIKRKLQKLVPVKEDVVYGQEVTDDLSEFFV